MTDIAAIVLAAGTSRRYREAAGPSGPATKLVARLDGKPLVRRVAETALASQARPVALVTGHARAEVEAAVAGLDVRLVHNPDYETGIASSLGAAIGALPPSVSGAVVLLGDMPLVPAALVDRLIVAFRAHPAARAVAPVYEGARGNPVLIGRSLFADIAALKGDAGARRLLEAAGADVIEVETRDPSVVFDIDTPDALRG